MWKQVFSVKVFQWPCNSYEVLGVTLLPLGSCIILFQGTSILFVGTYDVLVVMVAVRLGCIDTVYDFLSVCMCSR
jgi:hypothetical protein